MKIDKLFHVSIAFLGGFFSFWLGGFDMLLKCLLALTILDFISGIGQGIYNGCFSPKICAKGTMKKVFIYLTVVVAVVLEKYLIDGIPLRETVITFYIISEGMSVIENIGKVIDYPKTLKNVFESLKESEK